MEKIKKSIWDNDSTPYGTYEGGAGNPEMWKTIFESIAYSRAKAMGILGKINEGAHTVLGIASDASQDEIKKAYRKLAVKHHPDKGGNTEDFEKIHAAYSIMTNSM